jgi:hypothetical protein
MAPFNFSIVTVRNGTAPHMACYYSRIGLLTLARHPVTTIDQSVS